MLYHAIVGLARGVRAVLKWTLGQGAKWPTLAQVAMVIPTMLMAFASVTVPMLAWILWLNDRKELAAKLLPLSQDQAIRLLTSLPFMTTWGIILLATAFFPDVQRAMREMPGSAFRSRRSLALEIGRSKVEPNMEEVSE
jgi:hypothetical protein